MLSWYFDLNDDEIVAMVASDGKSIEMNPFPISRMRLTDGSVACLYSFLIVSTAYVEGISWINSFQRTSFMEFFSLLTHSSSFAFSASAVAWDATCLANASLFAMNEENDIIVTKRHPQVLKISDE